MKEWIVENPFSTCLVALSTLLGFRIFLSLWMVEKYQRDGFVRRMFWSLVVFFPMMGPLFFGAFYRPPSRHPDGGLPPTEGSFFGG